MVEGGLFANVVPFFSPINGAPIAHNITFLLGVAGTEAKPRAVAA